MDVYTDISIMHKKEACPHPQPLSVCFPRNPTVYAALPPDNVLTYVDTKIMKNN